MRSLANTQHDSPAPFADPVCVGGHIPRTASHTAWTAITPALLRTQVPGQCGAHRWRRRRARLAQWGGHVRALRRLGQTARLPPARAPLERALGSAGPLRTVLPSLHIKPLPSGLIVPARSPRRAAPDIRVWPRRSVNGPPFTAGSGVRVGGGGSGGSRAAAAQGRMERAGGVERLAVDVAPGVRIHRHHVQQRGAAAALSAGHAALRPELEPGARVRAACAANERPGLSPGLGRSGPGAGRHEQPVYGGARRPDSHAGLSRQAARRRRASLGAEQAPGPTADSWDACAFRHA